MTSVTLLSACQNTDESTVHTSKTFKNRATLADLVPDHTLIDAENQRDKSENETKNENNEAEDQFIMSKKQRAIKLASLYQNILTIEPDEKVRTKIFYRLAQIDTQAYELQQDTDEQSNEIDKSLSDLVVSYQTLIARYPSRPENEEVHYQLAKALSLQGKLSESLVQIELILSDYPESKYTAELHFRRGDIFYNLQHYTKALVEYQAVLQSSNSDKYYVNSLYMSGWTLFKLNRLPESDNSFLTLIDFIIAQEKKQPIERDFNFSDLDNRYVGLVADIQRVLSISLSQQAQATSLVSLVENYQGNEFKDNYLYLYRHLLFKNLADFLLENGLTYDAELTYQSYLTLAPNSIWAARYSLLLMDLYRTQGKHQAIQATKIQYVKQFGFESEFWQQSLTANPTSASNKEHLMTEVLPNLLSFSYQHSRYLYAQAQTEKIVQQRVNAFANTAQWLSTYLTMAKQPQAAHLISGIKLSEGLLADELLYADASFEAQHYQQALNSYEYIAYHSPITAENSEHMRKEAAYATTITIRKMLTLAQLEDQKENSTEQTMLAARAHFDKAFIEHYPLDERSITLAVQQAQYSFINENYEVMQYYCTFVLQAHGVIAEHINTSDTVNMSNNKAAIVLLNHNEISAKLTTKALKEVQITSQLQANFLYQQGIYDQAEAGYNLALEYVSSSSDIWAKMRELLASSIYFQGQSEAKAQPLLAVEHYLRLGKQIPESSYRLGAEFEAGNILFAQERWQSAVDVFIAFQQRYPNHEYSRSIPAKLANAYESIEQWQLAAAQYLAIVKLAQTGSVSSPNSATNLSELAREALYSAAALYLKADNIDKAINTFRAYAHTYPEPFDIAQEVRFKMSHFYQQTKEPNKEYYWYRKIIEFHDKKFSSSSKKTNSTTDVADPRAVYLVSVASLALGQAHQQTFNNVKLALPLNKSLARKQKAMKLAIDYYKKLLSFQLAEFVPQGTFNLAQMYRQLSQDVMSSQRPKDLDELALEEYNLLLEEMIYPFEEKAIEIHTSNAQRAWQNIYDEWVMKSFAALAELEPALYDRSRHDVKNLNKNNVKGGATDAVHTLH